MFGKAIRLFLLLIGTYLFLGVVAWLVPDWRVTKHVQGALDNGDMAEDYPAAVIPVAPDSQDAYTLDNFTDALILNQCLLLRSEGWRSMLLLPRYEDDIHQYVNLRHVVDGDTASGWTIHYPRYWHGSTYLTRILLAFMSFTSLRYLLYVLSTVLLLWCFLRLWKYVNPMVALAVMFALLMVNVFVMQFSVQFVQVLLLAIGGMLWLSYHRQPSGKKTALLFLTLGSLTAFLDLLTIPTLTLGLPLVVMVAQSDETDMKHGLWSVLKACLWWAGSYVTTWVSKWGIATLLTGESVFADAYAQAAAWQEHGGNYIADAFRANLGMLHWSYIAVPVLVLAVLAMIGYRRGNWYRVVQYAAILAIPLVFYLLLPHHSQHHSWYCYRGLATTLAALVMMVGSLVDWQRILETIKRLKKKNDARRATHTGD
jgi:hypothetical protein